MSDRIFAGEGRGLGASPNSVVMCELPILAVSLMCRCIMTS